MMKQILPIVAVYSNTSSSFSLLLKASIHELKHSLTVGIYLVYIEYYINEQYFTINCKIVLPRFIS